MAATRTRETRLSDEDVAKVMGLIKGSDSVELKLTVPETEHAVDRCGARAWIHSMRRSARCSSSTPRS